MKANNKEIKTFTDSAIEKPFGFGEYILFVEYSNFNSETQTFESVSKPTLAIIVDEWICDMAIAFDYVVWSNFNRRNSNNATKEILTHIEWNDFIDILGRWENKPTYKEMLEAYRKIKNS